MTLDDIVERLPKALEVPWPLDPAGQGSPFYQVLVPHVTVPSPPALSPAPFLVQMYHAERRGGKASRVVPKVSSRMS